MSKDYKANAEVILEEVEDQIKVLKRLYERGQLKPAEFESRIQNLSKDIDRIKFFLSL
jgi:hypothetical protein